MQHLGKNRFAFTLRLPNTFAKKHISFEASFAYGEEHLLEALERGQAISYRFMRDAKDWRIFASTQAVEKTVVSRLRAGCIGVDLNVGHVAVTETDRFGNGIAVQRIPLLLYALSTAQAETAIAQCVKDMIGYAIRVGKPISIETLNFARKKAQLSYAGPARRRTP